MKEDADKENGKLLRVPYTQPEDRQRHKGHGRHVTDEVHKRLEQSLEELEVAHQDADGQRQGGGHQPAHGDSVDAGPQVRPEGALGSLAAKLGQHGARRRQEHGRYDPRRRRRNPGKDK